MKKLVAFAVFALSISGCGRGFDGTFAGQENGTRSNNNFTAQVTVTLAQSGGQVTGNWSSSTGGNGTVSGNASGDQISGFAVNITSGSCAGTLTGIAQVTGNQLTATLTGNTQCGNITTNLSLQRL